MLLDVGEGEPILGAEGVHGPGIRASSSSCCEVSAPRDVVLSWARGFGSTELTDFFAHRVALRRRESSCLFLRLWPADSFYTL
jgi:hypothetical protein